MNIDKMLSEQMDKLEAIKVPIPRLIIDTSVTITSATSYYGLCRKRNGVYEIRLSKYTLMLSEYVVRRILTHELLHTLPGCMNHGKKWRGYASKVNQAYGYDITRVSPEPFPVPIDKAYKYAIKCTSCGHTYYRHRRGK